ncbi:hypothetical protein [Mucilaginibacter dorajii]|uniref:VanZ-like domain-containing protein n=1 Tax=Mucilaginibacter dorajii TaxID=692994 RepID=A0ABP7QE06_9SPHI|nr:hypothetical protein [Mucilaginibacter dorajii]MCS3733306.1 hypothetical protein [Mucilaginibacter dorajii]
MDNSFAKKLNLSYTINTKGVLLYYGLILFNLGLGFAKRLSFLQSRYHEFFSHTSNFIITSILVAVISFIWLLQGAPFKLFIWLGATAIVLNFVVELFVRFMNTPDVIDAVYGSAGALFTICVMAIIKQKGVVATTDLFKPKN